MILISNNLNDNNNSNVETNVNKVQDKKQEKKERKENPTFIPKSECDKLNLRKPLHVVRYVGKIYNCLLKIEVDRLLIFRRTIKYILII